MDGSDDGGDDGASGSVIGVELFRTPSAPLKTPGDDRFDDLCRLLARRPLDMPTRTAPAAD